MANKKVLVGLDISGDVNAVDFNSSSDKSLKYDINPLNIDIIDKLEPVEFKWKDTNKQAYGFIAQDVQEVLPEIVNTKKDGLLAVSYIQLIPFLIKEIQDLKQEIKEIKNDK